MDAGQLKNFEYMFDKYSQQSVYEKKHVILERKCQQLKEENEKLLHRLQQVKSLVRQYAEEQQQIISKLDEYSDDYRGTLDSLLSQDDGEHVGIDSIYSGGTPVERSAAILGVASCTLATTKTRKAVKHP